ncbi:glycoside hydrolase family 53 protein [Xylanibacter oryzae]|jgi:arabinogalactan endo-1,4-beta-galactosidase|uniref:glycoside hydrolase family 53 protein n=1 Tax=Xylanibacter oryzae TaxID=185293 RepID=UPI000564F8D6|nr:glycosyl hydrolase 53 family protein [Xylanibacter oryzae]
MKIKSILATLILVLSTGLMSCASDDSTPSFPADKTYDMTGFARGADVSWLTQMEKSGKKFYNANGKEMDCMEILRGLGVNAIRLRVWVNPADGWSGKQDVLAKAIRANNLGMRILIDFHYSDSWADPGQQIKPAAWTGMTIDQLKKALADHTTDILSALKDKGITPEWIQIGNEVRSGMLWDTDASISGATYDVTKDNVNYKTNIDNFAAFISAGSAAARAVFPSSKIVVHIDKGDDASTSDWIAGILKDHNVDYDVFALSLYPDADWTNAVTSCVANLKAINTKYGKDVMISEVGMNVDQPDVAKACLTSLMTQTKALSYCLGVFYWEPECYGSWNGYGKGAFDDTGKPTVAMDAFSAN